VARTTFYNLDALNEIIC